MKAMLTIWFAVCCVSCYGQYPYMNNQQYLRQLNFQNQMTARDLALRERAAENGFDRTIRMGQNAVQLRILKEQERFWQQMNDQTERGATTGNPFIDNHPLRMR